MLLNQAYQLFKIDRESYCTQKTLTYYDENVPKFINYVSEQLELPSDQLHCELINREIILMYISSLRNTGIKNTSINTYFRAVKTFINYCIDEDFVDSNVLHKVKLLKSDKDVIIPLYSYEVEQIENLYNSKTETGLRNLCILHLMLDAGFRSSDVVNLKYSYIDFDKNIISPFGKGQKFRSVILCPKLKRLLYRYLLLFRTFDRNDDYYVFTQIGTDQPINSNVIKQLFSRMKTSSGVERVHPHLCRHTFATSYILGGGNLEFLRLMLGHADYKTTKIYLHLAQEAKMLNSDIYKLDPVFFRSVY